jgi:hypothetical protein
LSLYKAIEMGRSSVLQYVFPQIETFKQETVSRVIFMQDGAAPHFSCFVTDNLNERFPDAWMVTFTSSWWEMEKCPLAVPVPFL